MARWEAFGPFRDWLEGELRARDWKPIDLARRVNPDSPANFASSISKWTSGKRQPDTVSCAVIADILGADLDRVLELAGHKPAHNGDELIDSIAASLRSLPRSQVEVIGTTVRALHDEALRRRLEGEADKGGGKRNPAKRIMDKAAERGNKTTTLVPAGLLAAAYQYNLAGMPGANC